jgi:hypothetical protein
MAAMTINATIRCTFRSFVGSADSAPATNSSESPGRNGVTTRPVSQNRIKNRMAYTQTPYWQPAQPDEHQYAG